MGKIITLWNLVIVLTFQDTKRSSPEKQDQETNVRSRKRKRKHNYNGRNTNMNVYKLIITLRCQSKIPVYG